VADNGVIGKDWTLPWHLPYDLAHFRRVTMGKPIVMGARTWRSIGRPLPGRTTVVLSRTERPEGVLHADSLEAALQLPEVRSAEEDRKRTRLNSSHVKISYAVFCLREIKNYNIQLSRI